MKKTLLLASLFVGSVFTMNAQTILFEDDFEAYSPETNVGAGTDIPDGYTSYDVNGTGYGWGLSNPDFFTQPFGDIYTGNFMISASYITGMNIPVQADNILTLPVISIPSNATNVELSFYRGSGTDPDYFSDTYDVIVTTENSQSAILAGTSVHTETLPEQGGDTITVSLDDYVGQDIYISFYHRDSYDQWAVGIDDIVVTANVPASVNNHLASSFSVYPNPVKDVLNISNSINAEINAVIVTDINGRTVKQFNSNVSQINISDLNAGVYFVNINSNEGNLTKKVVKQ